MCRRETRGLWFTGMPRFFAWLFLHRFLLDAQGKAGVDTRWTRQFK
jgi:hypothetical protein